MIRRIARTGLIQLAAILLIAVFCLTILPRRLHPHEEIWLERIELAESDREGKAALLAHGANLYRLTDLYLDGRPAKGCEVEQMTYDRCMFYVDEEVLSQRGVQHVSIGKQYFVLTKFESNRIPADFLP